MNFFSNIRAIAWKEAVLLRHDPALIAMVIAQPILMLFLFGGALSNEPANVPWAVIDRSQTELSRRLVTEIETTGYFLPPQFVPGYEEGRARLATGDALVMLVIPDDFRREAERGKAEVQLLLDGSDPVAAARVAAYVSEVSMRFETGRPVLARATPPGITLRQEFRFNRTLSDRRFFLGALAGMLLTNLCLSATSLGLVGERENGTFEQMLAQPTRPIEIVLGKLVPFVGLAFFVLVLALVGGGFVFGVWPAGSLLALLIVTLPFVVVTLAAGVLVSTIARTSGQAVFITVFFILPSFVLSGMMFPYQLMPDGVRQIGGLLPLRWYQIALRGIVLRGAGLADIVVPLLALIGLLALVLGLVVRRVKPRLG